MFEAFFGQDGDVIQELYKIETIILQTADQQNNDAFTCSVNDLKELACLDVASASTLASSIVVSNDTVPDNVAVFVAGLDLNTTATNLFGNDEVCGDGKRISDGQINTLDLFVYLAQHFNVPPYDRTADNPSLVATVQGETNVHTRCGDDIDLTSYALQLTGSDDPCYRPRADIQRRLLSARTDPTHDDEAIDTYTFQRLAGGTWYQIRSKRPYFSLNWNIVGMHIAEDSVDLSNAPVEEGMLPVQQDKSEVRFRRHAEDLKSTVDPTLCGIIVGENVYGKAVFKNTIAVSQYTSAARPYMCSFDIYLYLPHIEGYRQLSDDACPMVGAASSAIDGVDGFVTSRVGQCYDYAYASTLPPPLLPFLAPSASPPVSPPPGFGGVSPPPPPIPEEPPEGDSTVIIIISVVVLLVLTSTIAVAVGRLPNLFSGRSTTAPASNSSSVPRYTSRAALKRAA